jgi:predicted metal-dependent peptidase
MQTAEERITRSRVRLLLGKPFFGQLATRMKLIEAPDMPTAATDGRNFFFNREFIDRLDDQELDFLVGHEVLHMVFDHVEARGDREPRIYNMACDFNINMTLVEQSIGKVIGEDKLNGGKPCLDWKYRGMNSYEIYDDIFANAEKIDIGSMDVHLDPEGGDDEGQGSGEGGDGDGDGEKKGPARGQMTAEERKALRDEIKQAVIQASQSAGGDVPDSVKRMISELVAPKMDWRDLLRTNLESSLKNDFTFMRPSKRSGEVIFPGMNKEEVLKAFIAIDLSGSIGHELAREMLSEVQGIMEQYADYEIHVACFDTEVYNYDVFTSDDGRNILEYETKGGGGTDFEAVFKFLENEGIEPDQLVMFTDGYPFGSWGNPDYCDTLFVIHGDTAQRIQAPFGVTAHYE